MGERLVFAGAGDIILDRKDPLTATQYVAQIFRDADVAYTNMEQILADEGIPHPCQSVSKGTRFIEVYKDAQIDVVSCATNHAMDWGVPGLLGTIETLDAAGVAHMGTGKNLAEARKPAIIERKGVKFGFLNWCSVARPEYDATDVDAGLAPLKVHTLYQQVDFQPATPPAIISRPTPESLAMILEDVKALREQVDVLIMTFHWGQHLLDAIIPQYCVETAHAVIDAGADMVIGAHTHILKGTEIYKGKTIYYSTGNFILDFGEAFNDTRLLSGLDMHYFGGPAPKENMAARDYTMIAKAYIEDGEIVQTGFIPGIIIDGNPTPQKRTERGQEVVDYMTKITAMAHLNTKYEWINDEEVQILEA